jgi:hypothetical protein
MDKTPVIPTPEVAQKNPKAFMGIKRSEIKVLKPHSVDVDQIFRELNSRK